MNHLKKIGCCAFSLLMANSYAQNVSNQVQIIDPQTGYPRSVTYVEKEGNAIIEGDVIIGKIKDLQQKNAVVNAKLGSRWPNNIVPYIINENMPNRNRMNIQLAINEIESKTNVRFVHLTAANKDTYKDYVEYMPAKSTCSSYVGKIGGRQGISLAPGCYLGASIHESLHAIGFWHEQGRSDRDSYVQIVWENITESAKGNFNKITNGLLIGTYDYSSIMHYGAKAFSKNGKETIIPLQAGTIIGQRSEMSKKDIAAVNTMYPKI